jgi:hypothetical protein
MDESPKTKQRELDRISRELGENRLSRRGLIDWLKGLGVGFGAAFLLGMKQSDAHAAPGAAARLKSTNTALNTIIDEGARAAPIGEGEPGAADRPVQMAAPPPYRRMFRRDYIRFSRPAR